MKLVTPVWRPQRGRQGKRGACIGNGSGIVDERVCQGDRCGGRVQLRPHPKEVASARALRREPELEVGISLALAEGDAALVETDPGLENRVHGARANGRPT